MAPLSDISVCDNTQNLAGPFCSQVLGDLGASVIKVEPPGGDPARAWGPPFWAGDGTLFLAANRNKRSLVVDLKRGEGRRILLALAARSDVFLESSRPGVAERLGFDYETIRGVRDDVIYLSLKAFGDRGPMAEMPGYEPLLQAFAGMMSVTGHPGGLPARAGGSVVDFGTAIWSALGVVAALRERDQTGRGARVDTALLDTAVGWISYLLMGYVASGEVPGRMGTALGAIVPYQAFATRDGQAMILCGNDAIFARCCDALGVAELASDARFRTNAARVRNRDALLAELEPRIRALDTSSVVELMRSRSVPCSPIQDVAEVVGHPQVEAVGIFPEVEGTGREGYRDVALPLRIDGSRPRGARPVPRPGEHTREILSELGYDEETIQGLVNDGVVGV